MRRLAITGVLLAAISCSGGTEAPSDTVLRPLSHSDAIVVYTVELALINGARNSYAKAEKLISLTRASPCAVLYTEGFEDDPRTMREVLRENAGYVELPLHEVEGVLAELPGCPNPRTDRSWEDIEPEA